MTATVENEKQLERRLDAFQKEANQLRARRDKLNDQSRAHAEKRDQLNAEVRGLVNEANEHKKRRDELNEQVQRAKKLRDELNRESDQFQKAFEDLKRQKLPKSGKSIGGMKQELNRLEFDHQTKVFKPDKEKALIERMQFLQNEIKRKEKQLESDPELKEGFQAAQKARDKAERQHEKVGELAQSAQAEHEAMVKLFEKSDDVRKRADTMQEKFVVAKLEADKVHKEYMSVVEKIHEMEDELGVTSRRGGIRREKEAVSQERADEIFERFKQGEKLSTEDLMTLQKAGLL